MSDDNDEPKNVSCVKIGDMEITSTRKSLGACVSTAKKILKDKDLKEYLNISYPKKCFNGVG